MSTGKTIAIDFDGTLSEYKQGWQVPPVDHPTPGALQAMQALKLKGYTIVVFSCRAADPSGVQDIRNWLQVHGMLQFVSDITDVKPRAVAYIDDRGVPFFGNWHAALVGVDRLARHEKQMPAPPPQPGTRTTMEGASELLAQAILDRTWADNLTPRHIQDACAEAGLTLTFIGE